MAGRPAVFVRFTGCNMWSGLETDRGRDFARMGAACAHWCDTDFTKTGSQSYTAESLVEAMLAEAGSIRFCVLTGGEPLLQADATLLQALHAAGFWVAVETNGSVPLAPTFLAKDGTLHPPDWIVCSPKLPESELKLPYCDELKLVVPDFRPEQYPNMSRRVRQYPLGTGALPTLWLQPEDGPRADEATRLAIEIALAHPNWRVSVQTHKIIGVD